MATQNKFAQEKHPEWKYQWEAFNDREMFLFQDWIHPRTLEDFRGKTVLDAGCGPGHHMRMIAPYASHITGVDLNTADLASSELADLSNVTFIEGDLADGGFGGPFDVIYCIGVIDHTDNPDATFANLTRNLKEGGLMIIWAWSHEGNWLMRWFVEPFRKTFLRNRSRKTVKRLAEVLTAFMYIFVHTIYRLPIKSLPYYTYFENFRRLSFRRNALNTFDKLNAPQTEYITSKQIQRWFNDSEYEDVSITQYRGVSWRGNGIKRS